MKRPLIPFIALMIVALLGGAAFSQGMPPKYRSYEEFTTAVKNLTSTYSSIVRSESIGKSLKGRDLWLITLRKGNPDQPRAILVVGGVDPVEIIGSEMALKFAEHLAKSYGKVDSVTKLLETTTVYILPRVSPDAMEASFQKPLRERAANFRPTDDDHDGAVDEDDVDDVNGDGLITMMRINDPQGQWMVHPDDSRLMKKADPAKGEHGTYLLYTEGVDNDKDEQWNEDAVGGVEFNKNFPYNYQYFSPNSGVHQVSELETRAVAEFLFSKPNIAAVFSFSSNDNLTTPWKTEPRRPGATPEASAAAAGGGGRSFRNLDEGSRAVTSVLEDDQPYYEHISKEFLEITKLKDAPETKKGIGAFSEWVYYHAGRWSFSVRPWWAPVTTRRDTTAADAGRGRMRGTPGRTAQEPSADEYTEQLRALKWYDALGYKEVAVPWTKVKHADFPNRDVEVGGIRPYIIANPPADSLSVLAEPYMKFLTYLAGQLPTIGLNNIKVEKINDNVYRLTLDVVNSGYLPTNSGLGVRVRWPRNVYLTLGLSKDQSLASGKAKQPLKPIKGNGGFETVSWLVVGRTGSTVTVTAESPMAGKATETITLREGGRP